MRAVVVAVISLRIVFGGIVIILVGMEEAPNVALDLIVWALSKLSVTASKLKRSRGMTSGLKVEEHTIRVSYLHGAVRDVFYAIKTGWRRESQRVVVVVGGV